MGTADDEWITLEQAVMEYGEHVGQDVLFTALSYLILDGSIDQPVENAVPGDKTVWVLRMHVERAVARLDRRQWAALQGRPISVNKAAQKCNLPPSTFFRWLERGYLQEMPRKGRVRFLDEAEVAFLETLWAMVGKPGRALFPLLSMTVESEPVSAW